MKERISGRNYNQLRNWECWEEANEVHILQGVTHLLLISVTTATFLCNCWKKKKHQEKKQKKKACRSSCCSGKVSQGSAADLGLTTEPGPRKS